MMPNVALTRIAPKMPAANYQTYSVLRPPRTHWRAATCREAGCARFEQGWKQTIDLNTELGQKQARYIKQHSGRSYAKESQAGGVVVLVFGAGQECFTEHRIPLDRDSLFTIKGGDWRGNPRQIPAQRLSPIAWRDNFGEHQEKLAELAKRG